MLSTLSGCPTDLDCDRCGCRWSRHDATLHATLHRTAAISYYADYRALLESCQRCFAAGDRAALDQVLNESPKYRFVADRLRQVADHARVLEWGCSRGYLTATSILAGRNVLGIDVSSDAVNAARAAFGDHFALTDSPRVEAQGRYNAIYHVGLIGCVEDPIGLTRRLLGLLAPGGRLFFNSPNRDALFQRDQLWFDSAPPPELITLFPEGFWQRQFGGSAMVTETVVPTSPAESTVRRSPAGAAPPGICPSHIRFCPAPRIAGDSRSRVRSGRASPRSRRECRRRQGSASGRGLRNTGSTSRWWRRDTEAEEHGAVRRTRRNAPCPEVARPPQGAAGHRGRHARARIRWRPWAPEDTDNLADGRSVGPALREVFLRGVEGLPQARQREFRSGGPRIAVASTGCYCRMAPMRFASRLPRVRPRRARLRRRGHRPEFLVHRQRHGGARPPIRGRARRRRSATLNLDPARVEEAIVRGGRAPSCRSISSASLRT